ncbi:uncharacterized protein LOC129585854 [Paramacrobiotus metropolitanus]|uniref:uncharacterized protein LOC129585854 n=1 Tax=Paramacrobiotus metropolitanus TaxID=2943436 RepID=UPI0024456228|nr:uncharacterized protein LOC129585854 [Paramacrobiotus metropolitanus]
MSNTRRDWDQFGGSGSGGGGSYPSGAPDFTKSSGPADFSRSAGSNDSYNTSNQSMSMGTAQPSDPSQPFDANYAGGQVPPPTGLMGTVHNVAETAKTATMNAMEGGKNLARQASESAKNLATGAWEKISSMTGPKP